MKIINFQMEKMKSITKKKTKKRQEPYKNAKVCHIYKEIFEDKYAKDKKDIFKKVRDHCHYTGEYRSAAHRIFYLKKSLYFFKMDPTMIIISS